jgi:hypothetical protein
MKLLCLIKKMQMSLKKKNNFLSRSFCWTLRKISPKWLTNREVTREHNLSLFLSISIVNPCLQSVEVVPMLLARYPFGLSVWRTQIPPAGYWPLVLTPGNQIIWTAFQTSEKRGRTSQETLINLICARVVETLQNCIFLLKSNVLTIEKTGCAFRSHQNNHFL